MGKPTKPTKPTSPKGVARSGAGRRGRVVGYSPEYTPEQTQRYKSQALRYSKAVDLAASGPDDIHWNGQLLSSDDAANLRDAGGKDFKPTDRVVFRYGSQRSGLDYWSVRYGGGGLDDVESFADEITTTGSDSCSKPVVTWAWENPEFDWAADGIKKCEGAPQEPDGALTYTLPPSFSGTYTPVPPGATRTVTVRSTLIRTDDAKAAPPNGNGLPNHSVISPYVLSFTRTLTSADSFETVYQSGPYGVYGLTGSYGYSKVNLNGLSVNQDSPTGFNYCDGDGDYFSQVYITTVELLGDGPLLAPPPSSPPPFPLAPTPSGTDPPFPPGTTKATAGGTFTSNTFTATSALDVQSTLDYTTVPDIGDISGAIAVQLWSDGLGLVDESSETPTNGGIGTLEHTFSLEAEQSYYFKVVIPETCYCDAAKVTIGGAGFECDCPDYSKVLEFNYNSSYNSEQTIRDWTQSNAGCDQEQGCKHVIATKLFLGLPFDVPTDYPL